MYLAIIKAIDVINSYLQFYNVLCALPFIVMIFNVKFFNITATNDFLSDKHIIYR